MAEHRVLTTDQLAALAFNNVITARHRLDALARLGALNRFRPNRATGSAPWHYLLGPLGAVLLGAEDRDDRKWLPQARAGRQVALQRSQRLAHMIGTNWFFVALAAHARQGAGELRTWLTGSRTTEFFYQYPISLSALASLPQPDGAGVWADSGREIAFMLEYDTGSEHLAPRRLCGFARLAHRHRRYRFARDLPGRAGLDADPRLIPPGPAHRSGRQSLRGRTVRLRRGPGPLARDPSRVHTQEDPIDTAPLTVSQLASLPVTIDLMTAAKILGIDRTKAYELARHDKFPCLVIRVGDLYRVATADLLRILGASPEKLRTPPTAA